MENNILKVIADNNALFLAVKNVILEQFDIDYGAKTDVGVTNEDLGALLRARLEGLRKVENAFRKIALYKTVKEAEKLVNPAK